MALSEREISSNYDHGRCILCGRDNPGSLRISFEKYGNDSVKTTFSPNSFLQGYTGVLHGGVISSLLDSAMTHCLFHHGIKAVTGELNIRFLKPIPCNAKLEISASLLSSYPPLYMLKSSIKIDGLAYAKAEAKFMKLLENNS